MNGYETLWLTAFSLSTSRAILVSNAFLSLVE